ncbi:DUF3560 domain-containing protein [Sphaerisporangium flaviroseum]
MTDTTTTPARKPQMWIVHTRQHGTIIYGTRRGDGTGAVLSKHRFRGSEHLEVPVDEELGEPYWYLPHSQRSRADRHTINRAAGDLRDAGWTVEIRIDETTPAVGFWELEARKYQYAEYRAERLQRQAGAATATAESIRAANRRSYDALNGTPMLVDHHSYNRHKRLLERLWKREGKAFALIDKAGAAFGRAQAARKFQDRRESHGTTLRRIQGLERQLRDIERALHGRTEWLGQEPLVEGQLSELQARIAKLTGLGIPVKQTGRVSRGCAEVWVGVSEHGQQVLAAEMVEALEEIAYWEDLIAASGRKVWQAVDFTAGDFVQLGGRWLEVVKVSKRTLTVPDQLTGHRAEIQTMADLTRRVRHPHTTTIPYDTVGGKLTADGARERYPAAYEPPPEGELPKRPGLKRGKVHISGGGGARHEMWFFTLDGQDYRAVWPEPGHTIWYGPPTPIADPAPIKVFKTFGLGGRSAELVAELEVPAGIRWREQVFNVLRGWVEANKPS